MHKTIKRDNGTLHIIGNGHVRDILEIWEVESMGYEIPDWIDKDRYDDGYEFVVYKEELYCLSDIPRVERYAPAWLQEYDGILNDSFFSGVLFKYAEIPDSYGDMGIKVYWYYC